MYRSNKTGIYGQYDTEPTSKDLEPSPYLETGELESIRLLKAFHNIRKDN